MQWKYQNRWFCFWISSQNCFCVSQLPWLPSSSLHSSNFLFLFFLQRWDLRHFNIIIMFMLPIIIIIMLLIIIIILLAHFPNCRAHTNFWAGTIITKDTHPTPDLALLNCTSYFPLIWKTTLGFSSSCMGIIWQRFIV